MSEQIVANAITRVPDVLPDPVLTGLACDFGIGGPLGINELAPTVVVDKDSYKYAVWGKGSIKKNIKSKRAPGTGANEITMTKSFTTGTVEYRGLKHRIPDEILANASKPEAHRNRATRVLTNRLRLESEVELQALFHAASKTLAKPSTQFNQSNPTIVKYIKNAVRQYIKNCGLRPNRITFPPEVWAVVSSDDDIKDYLKYARGAELLETGVIAKIEGMKVVVPGAIEDEANPGAAESIAEVWSDDEVYLSRVEPVLDGEQDGGVVETMSSAALVRSRAIAGTEFAAYSWRDPDASARTEWLAVLTDDDLIVPCAAYLLRCLDVLN